MAYPEYKKLDKAARGEFQKAWQKKIQESRFYPFLYKHIDFSITSFKIYFLICFLLIIANTLYHPFFLLISSLGFLASQVLFAIFHTRIHALFLEYDEWHVGSRKRVMLTPIVSFYAFYHHHHSKQNNWMPELSFYDSDISPNGTKYIVLSHWYSFSFFYVVFKLPLVIFFVLTAFYLSPYYAFAALIGYEVGQFCIPVFHSYGHSVAHQVLGPRNKTDIKKNIVERILDSANGSLFFIMKRLGLLATPKQHAQHHASYNKTQYVYRSFSSSGIYSSFLDKWLDRYYVSSFRQLPNKAYDVMRPSALCIVAFFFLLPYFLACFAV